MRTEGQGEEEVLRSEVGVFTSCFVPLSLSSLKGKVVWQNPTPSSPRYCRPIRIAYEKETAEGTKTEFDRLSGKFEEFKYIDVSFNEKKFHVRFLASYTPIFFKLYLRTKK